MAMAVGFWSVRDGLKRMYLRDRAPDGGPALRPLKWHEMPRANYSWRACVCMVLLSLDMAANLVTDTVHWRVFWASDNPYMSELLSTIGLALFSLVVRAARRAFEPSS